MHNYLLEQVQLVILSYFGHELGKVRDRLQSQ
jgi:hypothetical protein